MRNGDGPESFEQLRGFASFILQPNKLQRITITVIGIRDNEAFRGTFMK